MKILLAAAAVVACAWPVGAHPGEQQRRIEVLAFSDDGTFALAEETNADGPMTTTTLLVVGAGGVTERLPVSMRIAGIGKDGVDPDTCAATADRLSSMAKDLRGVSVRVGLCSAPGRNIIDARGRPQPTASTAKTVLLHARVGLVGRVFVAPTGPLVVVVGPDALGNDRIATASQD